MKLQERTYREMTINSSQLIIPRETYQRELNPERVRKIVKEFDERVANEPKVSCRNGKYYVFDGQHTIAARKILNRDRDLPITCKVYYGMTESEEAMLFATQTGASAPLSAGAKIRALVYVTPATVKKIHNILRSAFHQAVKWELMEKNPAIYATVPKAESKKRDIWDAPTLFRALEVCEDERLKIAINLAFACSLRMGELLGLTWDCVDISPESIAAGKAYIYVNKELQRVDKNHMATLEKKDVLRIFPEGKVNNRTVLVLKKPKTATSTRKIFLPKTVAEMLVDWKKSQDFAKLALGDEYQDYDLVMANGTGMPTEDSRITAMFKGLIHKHDFPEVVFHSLRHSSITYKLKLNGGDIKAVQGDSGHAQATMVTDQYSHILDDDRRVNAELFENAFYSGKVVAPETATTEEPESVAEATIPAGVNAELLMKILANPEMAALLKTLAQTLE